MAVFWVSNLDDGTLTTALLEGAPARSGLAVLVWVLWHDQQLVANGVQRSMSRTGKCPDNAVENFPAISKTELIQ